MKSMKKLIPAIAMLIISAVLLSTASYAWFSMSTKVTATGMSIKATVPTQLLIKGSKVGAIYKSAIDFASADDTIIDNTLTDVFPVAYKARDAAIANPANTFKKLKSDPAVYSLVDAEGKVTGITFGDETAYEAATANTDYIYDTFTLKYAGELSGDLDNLQVTIKLTEAADKESDIKKAIHIIFVDDKSTPNVYEFDMSGATGTAEDGSPTVYTLADQSLTAFTDSNQEITYTVYVFYDGEDADCINDNTVNMDAYSIEFAFSLAA